MKNNKIFIVTAIISIIVFVGGFAGFTYYVDPLFHYHAPSPKLQYPLFSERYQNDGITRNFDYDAVIIGTSMTENFSTSRFDELFGTNSIKVPLSGASYRELDEEMKRAFSYNKNIKKVLRCLDLSDIASDKDYLSYEDYPDYLYDSNIFNDVKYLFNKDIFYDYTLYVYEFMSQGGVSTNFDAYKRWHGQYEYDAKKLVSNYERKEISENIEYFLSEDERNMLIGNVSQNVIATVEAHPDVDFYFYFPPYSILWWDDQVRMGKFASAVEKQRLAIEMLLPYENVHLYSFCDDYLFVCALNKYSDSVHYNMDHSNQILNNIAENKGLLTKDNYQNYLNMLTFYSVFDYDSYFSQIVNN